MWVMAGGGKPSLSSGTQEAQAHLESLLDNNQSLRKPFQMNSNVFYDVTFLEVLLQGGEIGSEY